MIKSAHRSPVTPPEPELAVSQLVRGPTAARGNTAGDVGLDVELPGDVGPSTLTVSRRSGDVWEPIIEGVPLLHGRLIGHDITLTLQRTTEFRVDTSGSGTYLPATTTLTLEVGAALGISIAGGTWNSSGGRVFHGASRPVFTPTLLPAVPGAKLHVIVQRREGGRWMEISDTTCHQSAKGPGTVGFTGEVVPDTAYRVRATWKGSAEVLAGRSDWVKFRFAVGEARPPGSER